MSSFLQDWPLQAVLLVALCLSLTWHNLISGNVPNPYLDEFFHVPQAQKYCEGDYTWDPKITTPPGLYLVAKFANPVFGCSTASLRALNVLASVLLCLSSYDILRLLRIRNVKSRDVPVDGRQSYNKKDTSDSTAVPDANTALNIALFPPLFFFSALFYTDVWSTLMVLLSYNVFLRKKTAYGSPFEIISAVVVGLVALLFRQTNIFWVAVFPAGLEVINTLKAEASLGKTSHATNIVEAVQRGWKYGVVQDCAVQEAAFQDYAILLLTVAIAVIRKPLSIIRTTLPYLMLLALFASFVIWNGSVVLGDKSAHTATIHLPQMLYIWPYITFFSAPLVAGPLLQAASRHLPLQIRTSMEKIHLAYGTYGLPDAALSGIFILVAVGAVHWNTIIHPYTLADNRHYVFYVFRIFRQHPAIKYLAIPVYYTCAWLVTNAIGVQSNDQPALKEQRKNGHPTSAETRYLPCQVSFLTIWLVTTTLSVVTAPLVEPRYFILPWIIWRLNVQTAPASLSRQRPSNGNRYDVRLGLETLWLLAINITIAHTFLYRGFTWPDEPGKVQRFLW
ncbi:DIE2/ALG10 family-domain-containing protein [Ampelomyces quisqualis]|uniref:Dol-P-Glc:Glc(2)Man(9)GlcNAc(2)-PP-Dol alpha-1,2-glucosyltransferase n=1 Tax=Ampelomyces quisqualis TaxID=50730 RepID=A0A6A5R1P4_AMPQU|nr:DIE2/ALG10 family-domain-containing protein [Ampelomyces quisqualis]